MDFITIISFVLYLATFLVGFALDRKRSNVKGKKLYIIWLYVFLCFGYMTGSDWRSYEQDYYSGGVLATGDTEFGFYFIFDLASKLNIDFWLFSGFLKCLFLFSVIRLLKLVTPYFTSCLSICMVDSLLFMLVDYPMRFTAACTFLLLAVPFLFQRKVLPFVLVSSVGIIFHNTIVITILFFLICYFCPDKILNINKYLLCIIFIVFAFAASNVSRVESIQIYVTALISETGVRDFSKSYLTEDNSSFFTIGSFINIGLTCFVFLIKNYFKEVNEVWKTVCKFAIVSSFFSRILQIVPTGFRLTIPLYLFSTVIIVSYLYKNGCRLKYAFIVLYVMMLSEHLYYAYTYIPYSNSIPYIITQDHIPYSERSQHNLTKFLERTGHFYQ